MIRTAIAAVVLVAGIIALGSDLVHTAYTAAQTARIVVLPSTNA